MTDAQGLPIGDNVLMRVDATVCWHINDVPRCAERAAETMGLRDEGGSDRAGSNDGGLRSGNGGTVSQLRNDVLKQAPTCTSSSPLPRLTSTTIATRFLCFS